MNARGETLSDEGSLPHSRKRDALDAWEQCLGSLIVLRRWCPCGRQQADFNQTFGMVSDAG
jgi:hypothetical protein